jgi:hypothetical protein
MRLDDHGLLNLIKLILLSTSEASHPLVPFDRCQQHIHGGVCEWQLVPGVAPHDQDVDSRTLKLDK